MDNPSPTCAKGFEMIHLDITGFYYRFSCELDGIRTVFDLMSKARGVPTANGGKLFFDADPARPNFCQTITVEYPAGSRPKSRQSGDPRPLGLYTYTDDVLDPNNRIVVPNGQTGLHIWQYYITNRDRQIKTGPNEAGNRAIVGFKVSDQEPYGAALEDEDTVTWRLVAIFGIADSIDKNRTMLTEKANGKPLGLKAAISMLK